MSMLARLVSFLGFLTAAVSDQPHSQCSQPYLNISDVWRSITRDCGGGGCSTPGCSPPDGPSVNCSCGPGQPTTGPCNSGHRDKGGPGGHWMGDVPLSMSCSKLYGDSAATGVGGNRWYRFVGAAGDALPLSPPGVDHCGTSKAGWLSGWTGAGAPPPMYNTSGSYPQAAEGIVEKTACFNHGPPNANTWCEMHSKVGVVRCGSFYLFRLSDSGSGVGQPGWGCFAAYCVAHSALEEEAAITRAMVTIAAGAGGTD